MTSPIRQAEPKDLAAVEEIVARAYQPYVARIGRAPGPMDDDYAALIADRRVHVCEDGGVIVALLVLIPEGPTLLLDNVAVHPDAHGRGHGRDLITFAETTAEAAGCTTIRLYTHELMTENQALYARLGYTETHRTEERGFARVFMAKRLG